MKRGTLLLLLLWACMASLHADTIYVSAQGTVKTLHDALSRARQTRGPHVIVLADGVYYLPETIVLTPQDNGLTIRAEHPRQAVISGGQRLSLKWKRRDNGVAVASIRGVETIDQLFVNGRRQRMARYPNATGRVEDNVFDCWALSHDQSAVTTVQDALDAGRIARWADPTGGYLHAMHAYLWGDMHWQIRGKTPDGGLDTIGGWQNNRPSPMHTVYRFVENIREELDAPGEWFYDTHKRTLLYIPQDSVELASALVEIVRLPHLVELRGTPQHPVKGIRMEGITFRHAARTFMQNREPLLRSDWTLYRGGAFVMEGTEDCTITDCDFDQLGGNSIMVTGWNRHADISHCYLHDGGASGIVFVGDTSCVRNPIFFDGHTGTTVTDFTPGPRTDSYPRDCRVTDCLITRTGRDEKQTAPIEIDLSYGIHISHCSIYDVPRAGINIGEGAFGGHVIEDCDVFNTVLETGDHGSFNSWGRDRFWQFDICRTSDAVAARPGFEQADMLAPNALRHNRWRCDHGWDIDLDDGSSNYLIEDNLLLAGGLKLREGWHRQVRNNIVVGNSLHPHVWYRHSGDVVEHNIFAGAYRPIGMDTAIPAGESWGARIDSNFFWGTDSTIARRFLADGCDSTSRWGDPLFVCAVSGDYRVSDDSPALGVGFRSFPTSGYGVVSARLRAIAKTPLLPSALIQDATSALSESMEWEGAHVTLLTGPALSAYGLALSQQGLAVRIDVPDGGAARRGLRTGDLIFRIDGAPVRRLEQLQGSVHHLTVMRNQKEIEL